MNVLKKIATPFVAIWRYIKETAWIQPLLIVGIIFAIIFSIPSITTGISNLINSDDDATYFRIGELSIEGTKIGEWNSTADKFFENFEVAQEEWINGEKDSAKSTLRNYSDGYDRFFLFFVQESCDGCANLSDGLEYVFDNYSSYMPQQDKMGTDTPYLTFKAIVTTDTFDDDYYEDEDIKPIECLVTSPSYLYFYETCMSTVYNTEYYLNTGVESGESSQQTIASNCESLIDTSLLQTPSCILIDLTESNTSSSLITEIFFGVSGDTKYEYADFVRSARIYDDLFNASYRN